MKKTFFNFMNRLEQAIFKSYAGSYSGVSTTIVWTTLIAAFASLIVIFFLQMFSTDESLAVVVLSIAFGLAFLFAGYTAYQAMICLPTIGAKIGMAAYVLVLFAACSLLFIWLATWVIIIALLALTVWLVLKAITWKKPGTTTVYFSDGTTEEVEYDGKDILGNRTYKRANGQMIKE